MTKEEFNQKKVDYLSNLIKQSTNDDDKVMLKHILSDLIYHYRITKHQYFWLQDKEAERARAFYEKNIKGRNFGAIGGGMTYHITPTGLGQIIHVSTINDKGEVIDADITDVSTW